MWCVMRDVPDFVFCKTYTVCQGNINNNPSEYFQGLLGKGTIKNPSSFYY